jgi:septum site-determining protein MinC
VIADRDIFVLGKLRGIAHAGASGNENAVIAALFFQPTQARIAGMIAQMPSGQYVHAWPAEMARIRAGRIVIEPWSTP